MPVAMMDVRVVRMAVHQRRMLVEMGVRLRAVPREIVLVLMMSLVHMPVPMSERLVCMFVLVTLGKVQPHTQRHEHGRSPEQRFRRLAQQNQRKRHTNEGRSGKIRTSARAPQMPHASTNSTRLTP